jgi:hypothetical protein
LVDVAFSGCFATFVHNAVGEEYVGCVEKAG